MVATGLAAGPRLRPARTRCPDLVRYRGPIEHIFVHPLLPARATRCAAVRSRRSSTSGASLSGSSAGCCPQLYANDWVLVDLESLIRKGSGRRVGRCTRWPNSKLPPGKKPLVLSIDDLNHPQYMIDNHLNSKLVLDGGDVAAERMVTPNGTTRSHAGPRSCRWWTGSSRITPDFSINGAKGSSR